jgi:hypothetical protein
MVKPELLPQLPRKPRHKPQYHTITRDEYERYDEWVKPPYGTPLDERYVWFCQNPNCAKSRDLVANNGKPEELREDRCEPCYRYRKRTGKERPRELVLQRRDDEAKKRADEYRQRQLVWEQERRERLGDRLYELLYELDPLREESELESEGVVICQNGHFLRPDYNHLALDDLDNAGRCPACRRSFYKTGKERSFDYEEFAWLDAESATDDVAFPPGLSLEAIDALDVEYAKKVFRGLLEGAPDPAEAERRVRDELAEEDEALSRLAAAGFNDVEDPVGDEDWDPGDWIPGPGNYTPGEFRKLYRPRRSPSDLRKRRNEGS